jgi:hypothetical protein
VKCGEEEVVNEAVQGPKSPPERCHGTRLDDDGHMPRITDDNKPQYVGPKVRLHKSSFIDGFEDCMHRRVA